MVITACENEAKLISDRKDSEQLCTNRYARWYAAVEQNFLNTTYTSRGQEKFKLRWAHKYGESKPNFHSENLLHK